MSTEEVFNHHQQAFLAGDLEELMKDYTEGSTLVTPDGTITGLQTLRSTYKDLFNGLFKPGTYTFTVDRTDVVGDIAFIVWHSKNQGAEFTLGTDTFLIRDGKIVTQTVAAKMVEK